MALLGPYSRKNNFFFELYKKEGDDLYKKGSYAKAMDSYDQAIENIWDDIPCLVARSKCLCRLGRFRKALDEADIALHLDVLDKTALLQKANVLYETGNYQLALVYYHRGHKQFPKSKSFNDGMKKAQEGMNKSPVKNKRGKLTAAGDLSFFVQKKKQSPRPFVWEKKPKVSTDRVPRPSAGFRQRFQNPLIRIHKTPAVVLVHASSLQSVNAASTESLPEAESGQNNQQQSSPVDKKTTKVILGQLYEDRNYLEGLLKKEGKPGGHNKVAEVAGDGLNFLQNRVVYWDRLGPLPPPPPPRKTRSKYGSSLSLASSVDSISTVKTTDTRNTWKSTDSRYTGTGRSKGAVKSKLGVTFRPEKPQKHDPSKISFNFKTYKISDRMGDIAEEEEGGEDLAAKLTGSAAGSEAGSALTRKSEALSVATSEPGGFGGTVAKYIREQISEINTAYGHGNYDHCSQKAEACLKILNRYADEEVSDKFQLQAVLYSWLGNVKLQTRKYEKSISHHTRDLLIGEQHDIEEAQCRALGNLGKVYTVMGKYNRALDMYTKKAPLCKSREETASLFHEIGNCFLMMRHFEYAKDSGKKSLHAAEEVGNRRFQLQARVLIGISEVNMKKYEDAYQSFEDALDDARVLEDKRAEEAMKQAMGDVNNKMVLQMKTKNATQKHGPAPRENAEISVS